MYKKSDELLLKSQFEKAITCLRWNPIINSESNEREYQRENVFDYKENNFDFGLMKATTLPFNKRVYMPSYIDDRTEARITHARKEIEIIIEEHVSSNKRKSLSNLTKQQYEGLKLLRERVRKN